MTASHSLPPANAKDVSSAITPDRSGDKPPAETPKPAREQAPMVAPQDIVPKVQENGKFTRY